MKSKTGTREWAEHNRNIQLGCENDCRYCYAREMAVRFKRKRVDTWKNEEILNDKLLEKPKKLSGRIMFPTTHDITQGNMRYVASYLKDWLEADNEILIVSKPDPVCIAYLCEQLAPYKSQITFRFTIGSRINPTLDFWEPNAPSQDKRMEALEIAFNAGFKTSVSCEPYLDDTIQGLVYDVLPFVTDVVWIGKMNMVKKRVILDSEHPEKSEFYMRMLEEVSNDIYVKGLYKTFRDNPKVKWKDSIKQVIGLAEEEIG